MLASELRRRLKTIIKDSGDKEIMVDDKDINAITEIREPKRQYYNMLTLSKKEARYLPM